MARNEQLIRQHKLLQIIERYRFGRTVEEIRDELVEDLGLSSLHARTVRRDIEALQAAGIHLVDQETERGRVWKLGAGARGAHKIAASATELISLSLGRDLLHPLAGTPFWQGIESFWSKLQDELPDSIWDHFDRYRRVLHVIGTPTKSYQDKHGILSTINRAILQHRVVETEYQSLGKSLRKRLIEPYAVVVFQSSLYILAADHELPAKEERMRHWKLDRFRKAMALDEWFKPESEFDPERYLGKNLGIFAGHKSRTYRIRISPFAASWVREDPWHPDQQLKETKDGDFVLTVQANHDLEIIPRVLALGSEAEILSPASCRRAVTETIKKLGQVYGG